MTRDNNNKLRAVFLAALMFLWLFAGTVAFAGSAAAQDRTIDDTNVNGASIFQGQETEFDFSTVNTTPNNDFNVTEGDTVQIQRVTDRDSGNPITATTSLTGSLDSDNTTTFETDSLQSGESYVIRFETTDGDTGFLAATDTINDTTLSSGFNAAEFGVNSQTMSTAFENDDEESEVRAGEDIDFDFTSNERASFFVNVTEADDNLDNEDLQELFFSSGGNNLSSQNLANLENPNLDGDDDAIQIEITDNNFDEEITVGSDIDAGEYELEFEVNDTTAESTADLTILEDVDADADFDEGTFTETRGDIVEISGTVQGNTDQVNLTVGTLDDDGYQANATVETNDDDEFTVLFNTRTAGQQDISDIDSHPTDIDEMTLDDGAVFGTAEDQGDIISAEETGGSDDLDAVLAAGTYDLQLQEDGESGDNLGDFDVATMDLTERSTDSMQVWRADASISPEDEEVEDIDAILNSAEDGTISQTNQISIGDVDDNRASRGDLLVHQIGVSGVQGVGTDAAALLANEGNLTVEYEQVDSAPNQDALELNLTATGAGNFDTIVDRNNDTVYAIVSAEDIVVQRPDDDSTQTALPTDETFEVRYNVSARYAAEFDRDNVVGDDGFELGDDDQIASQEVSVVDRQVEFDTLNQNVTVPPSEDAEISGTTTIAPGTEFDIRAQGTGDAAFLRTADDVTVNDDGTFSGTLDFSDIESGTEFDAEIRQQNFEDNGEAAGVVAELEGATFSVSNLAPQEAEVEQGTAIDVSATITNEGDSSGNQSVALTLDGDELDSQQVELDAGEETEVAFEGVDTSELAEGSYEHGIATDDDSATGTLTITVPSEGDDGASDDGSADDGGDGSADDGEMDDGAADDGGDDGAADDGTEDQPGFGAVVALIALLGAALLAARRNAQE
ncbi:BGTF surface domain-containing protein [Natronomonas sp.]|uniref:BGTF surface domain-containing protein n=1 Tax=Natronomonas sp. TaxID=2184060 RepID=UPI0026192954|nr:BGTF surface domain-containing protein [Natronomonas sp.]